MSAHEVAAVDDLEVGDVIQVRKVPYRTLMWAIEAIEEYPRTRSLLLRREWMPYPVATYKRRGTLVYRDRC